MRIAALMSLALVTPFTPARAQAMKHMAMDHMAMPTPPREQKPKAKPPAAVVVPTVPNPVIPSAAPQEVKPPLRAPEPPTDHTAMDMTMPGMSPADHQAMQHTMGGQGSGTSRLPASSAHVHGATLATGDWNVMLHGYVTPVYTDQGGPRGGKGAFVESHMMLQADHALSNNIGIELRTIVSAEPLIGERGYQSLFATGETAYGVALIDRQHPHNLIAELSARLNVETTLGNVFVYGGPVAEPALGPTVYLHRPSAKFNPDAPITHHWFDSTHLSYGVITSGVRTAHWQLEGSAFRGREPGENRYTIETPRLDSYSGRMTWLPDSHWAIEASYGHLNSPEGQSPNDDEARYIGTAIYANGRFNAMGGVAVKQKLAGRTSTALLFEANLDFHKREAVFTRIESVDNDELFNATPLDPHFDRPYRVSKFTLGYGYTIGLRGPLTVTVGGVASVYAKPATLDSAYGKFPVSGSFFAKFALGG